MTRKNKVQGISTFRRAVDDKFAKAAVNEALVKRANPGVPDSNEMYISDADWDRYVEGIFNQLDDEKGYAEYFGRVWDARVFGLQLPEPYPFYYGDLRSLEEEEAWQTHEYARRHRMLPTGNPLPKPVRPALHGLAEQMPRGPRELAF